MKVLWLGEPRSGLVAASPRCALALIAFCGV